MSKIPCLGAAFLLIAPFFAFADDFVAFKNIPYVEGGGERQQLDLYLPKDYEKAEKPTPVVLVVHGGGWGAGNKDWAGGWAPFFVPQGFAVVGINYRYQPEFPLPAQIVDCKSAVRWLRAHAKKYNLDPEHFGAMGHSAGGHLSALLGVTGSTKEFDLGDHLDQSSEIQAVCDMCGPADFVAWFKSTPQVADLSKSLFGGPADEKAEIIRKMSPTLQADSKSAPMLIIHAPDDDLVPYDQSHSLADALKKAGATYELFDLPKDTGGHASKDFHSEETKKKILEFFKTHLD